MRQPQAARRYARAPVHAALPAAIVVVASLAACTAEPGPSLTDAAPGLDARSGLPDGALEAAHGRPWDRPSEAWDGRSDLTAEAAVRCALENNRVLRRTLAELDRRRALVQDAHLPPNPSLSAAIGAPIGMGSVPVLAMLGQQVDWLWRRDAVVGEADASLRTMLLEAASTVVATVVEARAAYVDAASAAELRALAGKDADVAARVLAAEEAAFRAGEARGTAVNQARMNAGEASNRVMEAQLALVAARTRLLEAIGRGDAPVDGWNTADATASAALRAAGIEPPAFAEDEEALRQLVREQRLDLRAARARTEGVEARVRLATAGRLPTLILGAGYEQDMEGDRSVMFEAQSALPVLNTGAYRLDAAVAELEMSRIEEDRLWQRAVIDARRALAAIAAAEHHAAVLREVTLGGYESNRRILAEGVAAGETNALELWRSEHQENHVRIQIARAERDRALAALGLERSLAGARLSPVAGGPMGAAQPGTASATGMGMGGASATAMPDFEFTALEAME